MAKTTDPNKAQRLILAAPLLPEDQERIGAWARALDWAEGAELKDASSYHVTALYCKRGRCDLDACAWLASHTGRYELTPVGVEMFSNPGYLAASPVVLRFEAASLATLSDELYVEAEDRGLEPQRHATGYKPHITLGFADEMPQVQSLPAGLVSEPLILWS